MSREIPRRSLDSGEDEARSKKWLGRQDRISRDLAFHRCNARAACLDPLATGAR
jgi:hypothetical protein